MRRYNPRWETSAKPPIPSKRRTATNTLPKSARIHRFDGPGRAVFDRAARTPAGASAGIRERVWARAPFGDPECGAETGGGFAGSRKAGDMADVVLRKAGGDARCAGGAQAQVREQKQERRPVQERLQGQARPQPQAQKRPRGRGPVQERNRRRVIFHSDMNAFYASVEQAERPELRGRAARGGRARGAAPRHRAGEERAGEGGGRRRRARRCGRRARSARGSWWCRRATTCTRRTRAMARRIYYQYTDLVEPFGLDEAWLDLTGALRAVRPATRLDAARRDQPAASRTSWAARCPSACRGTRYSRSSAATSAKPDAITAVTPAELPRPRVAGAYLSELLYVGGATRAQAALVGHRHHRRLGLRLARAAAPPPGEGGLRPARVRARRGRDAR